MEIKFIISNMEVESYDAWWEYLDAPESERKVTKEMFILGHKIKETLDGYGVELKNVIPTHIRRKKDTVTMKFKFVDNPTITENATV